MNQNTDSGITITGSYLTNRALVNQTYGLDRGKLVHDADSRMSVIDRSKIQKLGEIFQETLEIIEDPEAEDRDFEELRAELIEVLAHGIAVVEGN